MIVITFKIAEYLSFNIPDARYVAIATIFRPQ